ATCSTIADGFDGFGVHLANHDVTLAAVSRAPLAKLQAYKRRMGWTFPWASSFGSDFNPDFNVSFTEQQQREGSIEYNYERSGHAMDATAAVAEPVVTSAAVTIGWCASMSATGGMTMPGGWTMSMAWMRMPGQTWPGAAASFLGMWIVMMVAMMLPSLVPMLWRYRQTVVRTGETRLGRLTALVGMAYFLVWTMFGMAAFPLGVVLAAVEMQLPALARAVPLAVRVVVLIAGALQFTTWKAHHLAFCLKA